jgi:hypothetical protein
MIGTGDENDLRKKEETKNWFLRHAETRAKCDSLSQLDHVGFKVRFAGALLVLFFFTLHQVLSTGFFTLKFSLAETLFLYVPLLFAMVMLAAKIFISRENMLRPFDMLKMVLIAIAGVWLFNVFPFDFSHLTDLLPNNLQFMLLWVTNEFAKVVIAIISVAAFTWAVYIGILYVVVLRELWVPKSERRAKRVTGAQPQQRSP